MVLLLKEYSLLKVEPHHTALVARQMGKVCVCGAHGMTIDYGKKTLSNG